ncbi:hypothetical protein LCGC14_3153740 [marine sediment metagenome]|uniref:Uncharacterized protein n=1 Tax=marine sediment metagenome TaxID=412755 RepID=A0A0F8VT95_9ZZZZ
MGNEMIYNNKVWQIITTRLNGDRVEALLGRGRVRGGWRKVKAIEIIRKYGKWIPKERR